MVINSFADTGLSPRVRGNRVDTGLHPFMIRSIPACAGEPALSAPSARGIAVYPRVCGGTADGLGKTVHIQGLSPRVRGNLSVLSTTYHPWRSIPACAGEPLTSPRIKRQREVYPRVCGGTNTGRRAGATAPGLSPRVRGNRLRFAAGGFECRSIPACAGEPISTQAPTAK